MAPHLVMLGDGRALAVGNDQSCLELFTGAPDDSVTAELYDPVTGKWTAAKPLDKPRALEIAVSLPDGRALVAGGATSGVWDKHADKLGFQSYSSSWIFDPRTEAWSRTELMRTARGGAAGAVLEDGRVLAAGGFFVDLFEQQDFPWWWTGSAGRSGQPSEDGEVDVITAAWRPHGVLADVVPDPPPGKVLASVEVLDPATGRWSASWPMAVPRYGGSAVTLADGRVMVAGYQDLPVAGYGVFSDWLEVAPWEAAEVFDPADGRFDVTARFPAQTKSAALIALSDGGSLLIGGYGDDGMPSNIVLRYQPDTNNWIMTGPLGFARAHPAAVLLPGGRVLVAGGEAAGGATAASELYDPVAGTWAPAPAMPEPRAGGTAVVLSDGSVLLAGGWNAHSHEVSGNPVCPQPVATAVRFRPEP